MVVVMIVSVELESWRCYSQQLADFFGVMCSAITAGFALATKFLRVIDVVAPMKSQQKAMTISLELIEVIMFRMNECLGCGPLDSCKITANLVNSTTSLRCSPSEVRVIIR